jgi:hypothetical protein
MRGSGVAPCILQRAEAGPGLFHRFQDVQQVAGGAGQAIQPGHHQHVPVVALAPRAGPRRLGRYYQLRVLRRLGQHRAGRRANGRGAQLLFKFGVTSAPLGIALMVMLRYAVRLRAGAVTMMGALAVAAITSTARAVPRS